MINKKFDNVLLLLVFAFALALCLRVLSLGATTLSDAEASFAFSSLKTNFNPQFVDNSFPGIANFNAVLFSVFDTTNFVARLITAIIGAGFVFIPLVYKRQLGLKTLVILGFVFGLDAILVAQSRILGSSMWAILFSLIAVGSFINNHPVPSGISAGLALLGGASVWYVVVGLGFSLLWTILAEKSHTNVEGLFHVQRPSRNFWIRWTIALSISLFIFGSTFFTRPEALSGIIQGIITFIKTWTVHFDVPSWQRLVRILISIPIYQPIILIFGITGFILGIVRKNSLIKFVGRWFLVSFFILFINPSKEIALLTTLTVPLCVSTSWVMGEFIQIPNVNRQAIVVKAAFVVVLCGFSWLNAAWIIKNGGLAAPDFTVRLLAIIGGIVMIILVTLLIGWGWSWQVAKTGLMAGLLFVLLIYNIDMLRRAAGYGTYPGTELITGEVSYPQAALITRTMDDLITKNELDQQVISVSFFGVDSPSLEWAFRKIKKVEYLLAQDPGSNPLLFITPEGIIPVHADLYRGEAFIWDAQVPWDEMQIMDWLKWLAFQQAPVVKHTLTLWAQNTLFPKR
jgi:hypothetical protein